jgi:hypothetical protein
MTISNLDSKIGIHQMCHRHVILKFSEAVQQNGFRINHHVESNMKEYGEILCRAFKSGFRRISKIDKMVFI